MQAIDNHFNEILIHFHFIIPKDKVKLLTIFGNRLTAP
jgi:hypothetical protein